MIGIIAFWETLTGTEDPIYLKAIWKDTIKPLNATHLYYVDEEGVAPKHNDVAITYKTFSTLSKAIKEHPKAKYVFLVAERNVPKGTKFTYLKDFVHPKKDVIYVFGKDSSTLPLNELPLKGNHLVAIKTFENYAMWSLVVAGIVLYDRKVKE